MTFITSSISSLGSFYGVYNIEESPFAIEVHKYGGLVYYFMENNHTSAKYFTDAELMWSKQGATYVSSVLTVKPTYTIRLVYNTTAKIFNVTKNYNTISEGSTTKKYKQYLNKSWELSPPLVSANASSTLSKYFKILVVIIFVVALLAGIFFVGYTLFLKYKFLLLED